MSNHIFWKFKKVNFKISFAAILLSMVNVKIHMIENNVNHESAKQICSRQHSKLIWYRHFSEIIRLDITCDSAARQMIHMKCHVAFPLRNKKKKKKKNQNIVYCSFSFKVMHRFTKTRLYNIGLLKSHFYKVKLGFTRVYIIFLISAQSIDWGTR